MDSFEAISVSDCEKEDNVSLSSVDVLEHLKAKQKKREEEEGGNDVDDNDTGSLDGKSDDENFSILHNDNDDKDLSSLQNSGDNNKSGNKFNGLNGSLA